MSVTFDTSSPHGGGGLATAKKLLANANGFACLCQNGQIVALNSAALQLLDLNSGESLIGQHFQTVVHEGDAWTLNSWWGTAQNCPAFEIGTRSHCRLGSASTGWHSLELTLALHWADGAKYQIIFGRDTANGGAAYNGASHPPRLLQNTVVLRRERVKRKWAERNIRRLAYQDQLTGLINRPYFQVRLKNTLRHAARSGRSVALLVIDIDHFKDINGRLGSKIGDKLLQLVAERIKHCMRTTDCVARLGGDEFAIIVRHATTPKFAEGLAQKLVAALAVPFSIEEHELSISSCVGVAHYPTDADDADLLQKNSHLALTRAKQAGFGNVQVFDAALNEQTHLRKQLEDELSIAINADQLVLHYQPQVDIATGAVRGIEALIRWQHPERGMIPPVMFVPIAEASGLILPMTEWVMRKSCIDLKRCLDMGLNIERVSVNLSANLLHHKGLCDLIGTILSNTGLPARRLEVEITESMVMDDIDKASVMLNSLYLLGVGLALDDFGTGYSSLTYLRQFPLSTLKIDRSFITEMSSNAEDIAIVRAVIALAHSLHLLVIAEGVEEEKQLQILKDEKCDQVQGYYYSRPLPLEDLITWCRARQLGLEIPSGGQGIRAVS